MTVESILPTLKGKIDSVSWQPSHGMTFDQWGQDGRAFKFLDGALNWWIGDWLNEGERRYGETYTQAIEFTGHKLEQLTVCKYVAGRVRRAVRREALSWSHHRYVAPHNEPVQVLILTTAERLALSSRDTKAIAQLDEPAIMALLGAAERLGLTGLQLMEQVVDYENNLASVADSTEEDPAWENDVPFSGTSDNPLYNAEASYDTQAGIWAGTVEGYDWQDDEEAPQSTDGKRRVMECFGLWEYAHTDEDGHAHYHLVGVADNPDIAQMWLTYRDGVPFIKVIHVNPLEGIGDDAAIQRSAAGGS